MLGDRRKVRGEFRHAVSVLGEARLSGDAEAAEAAIARLGELLPAIRRHDPVLDDAVPLVGFAAGRLLARRETALRPALALFRSLLEVTPFESGLQATMLMMVGEDLLRVARQTREQYLVDEAITLAEASVTTAEPGSQLQAFMLSMLADAYQLRFGHLGHPVDLDRAIASYRMAADSIGTGTDAAPKIPIGDVLAICLDGLATCLSLKFEQTGELTILDHAVDTHRQVLQTMSADDLNRPAHLNKLSLALHQRYTATGCADELDEAVTVSAEAVSTGVPDSTGYASWLIAHAVFLLERYGLTGDHSDVERSITLLRRAARTEPSGSASQARYLSTLGTALNTQHLRTTDLTALAEAVSVHRQAVAATPAGHPARPGRLTRLGDALQETFAHSEDLDTLDEAIDIYREAVSVSPPQDPDSALVMGNLGVALGQRYEATGGRIEDVDEAIILLRRAVDLLAEDHPNRAVALSNLDRMVELRSSDD